MIRYKFLIQNKSKNGDHKWRLNKWYKIDGDLEMCHQLDNGDFTANGFHCSKYIQDALSYVNGDTLAVVECRGKHIDGDDKEVWEEMRVIKRYKWTKKHSIKMATYSARLCLPIFEDQYPNDDRPRKAIEAAEKVLEHDTKANRSAAVSAAWSAAESAAESAARSAEYAAWSAVREDTKKQIHEYVLSLFGDVKE